MPGNARAADPWSAGSVGIARAHEGCALPGRQQAGAFCRVNRAQPRNRASGVSCTARLDGFFIYTINAFYRTTKALDIAPCQDYVRRTLEYLETAYRKAKHESTLVSVPSSCFTKWSFFHSLLIPRSSLAYFHLVPFNSCTKNYEMWRDTFGFK